MYSKIIILISTILSTAAFAACPAGTADGPDAFGKQTCVISGVLTSDLSIDSTKNWMLSGAVFVGSNKMITDLSEPKVKLNIAKGTKIYGLTDKDFLVVDRGGQIFAKGEKEAPIVFTSARQSNRSRGLWGGLIINGNAPVNGCDTGICELEGEGSTGKYGGPLSKDSSGVLNYVVVEWAGSEITPDNELNGIAFQGVGSGTDVDYVQVHMNSDDGVEFFGGTVNVKHLVLTGIRDDSLDWVAGWKGSAQFVIIKQADDAANHGIEADNANSPMDRMPRSAPTLSNMTLIGTTSATATGGSGILLRKGTGAYIYNTVISGFKSSCIDLDDNETFRNALEGSVENNRQPGIIFENVYASCAQDLTAVEADEPWALDAWFTNQSGNRVGFNVQMNGFLPTNSLQIQNLVSPQNNDAVIPTDYVGATKDENDLWYDGWTTSAQN
jgi:hypothetical protein